MRQVAVFAPMGTLDHQTGILNAVRCFAAAGWQVDVYTVRNLRYPQARFESSQVTVRHLPVSFDAEREPRMVVTLLFTLWMLFKLRRLPHVVFAGGIRGLFAAYACSLLRSTQVINYQTELYIGEKLDTRAARLFKAVERRAAQRSRITIEHDATRRDLLSRDLGVPLERILVVPNAPCGPARRHTSRLLHERFGLDSGTPILLCPGTISPAFATELAVQAAQRLREPWRCVVHSAQPRADDDAEIRALRAMDSRRCVLFSLAPVDYARIDDLLGSARVGLVLYSALVGDNTAAVGLASGKLSHFLKLGVPVIVSPLPGLADFVLRHRVGEVLHSPDDLPQLIARINADAEGYRARALKCFDEHLSYDRAFRVVLDVAETLAEPRRS